MLLADTEVQTRLHKLLTQVPEESLSKASSAIERPLSRGHADHIGVARSSIAYFAMFHAATNLTPDLV